jgi:hypothetical protein
MADTPEETAKRFEDQSAVQKMQHEMLIAQQQSIDELKNLMALLLKQKKTRASSVKTSSSSGRLIKGKEKEAEHLIFEEPRSSDDEHPQSSSEEGGSEHGKYPHLKKVQEFEKRIEAIAHRGELHDVGVIRPYPIEWDSAPYPSKFKALTLHTFDEKSRPTSISTTSSLRLGM